jgi:hypothetical protein
MSGSERERERERERETERERIKAGKLTAKHMSSGTDWEDSRCAMR